ncbi:UDP-N-acetylmuramoyl-L-alanine--D-glutamate ligase [Roseateles sp. DAIF2]|uniref:UDP-N-acetylmuramoyl-L-alanine--D-glutamate ligase n=1 Tax=Roseateles sp. DAIF2 TaxID=2714952 RepID=UPI0018A2E4A0|nr:UDP-N-acetylmuramoyl-L-alanine--D-glutamate ligase [Roseateles sp. DAIF2]QPF75331.1 UDP-N-acetylmuramoyl-L-alanine--D-glutamate ligase [Roseateles sp. DAIF2]
MKHLAGLHTLILGLGDSGLAMAAWVLRHGGSAKVWDSREQPPRLAALRERLPAVEFFHGELPASALNDVKLVLKSPGLSPLDARLAPLLGLARATGIPVQGELELFARALADLKAERRYDPAVLAITGTNGKTTTTSMTAQLVERAGRRVAVAGNIGPTLLDTLAQALDLEPAPVVAVEETVEAEAAEQDPTPETPVEPAESNELETDDTPAAAQAEPAPALLDEVAALLDEQPLPIKPPPPKPAVFEHLPEVWVLELSSFQLDGVTGFEPTAAAVLNLTQDHLDWHGDMPAYGRAKARIFGESAVMVINRDDALVEAMVPAPVKVQQGRGRPAKLVSRQVLRFGLDAPQRPGDYGLVEEGGMAWLVRAREADETQLKRRRGDTEEDELSIQRLMPADALRVRGRHNAANALAALALAGAAGCPLAPMLHGLREYRGEPHRVEHVATVQGVDFYDDSKGTNVGATVAAITGLGADRAPARLVLILGGDGKGQDFSPLREPLARHARAVALIGRDAPAIASVLPEGLPAQTHETLQAATRWALTQAHSGDSVLLSPACASLDMFRNYAHRAEVFVAEVQALADEGGLA